EAHLAKHGRLVTLRAAGVDRDGYAPVGRLLPLVGHLLDVLVPDGTLRHERRELDRLCRSGRCEKQEDYKERDGTSCSLHRPAAGFYGLRLAVHSPWPIPLITALPLTIESPLSSPVSSTGMSPCGVFAVNESFSSLPSRRPVTSTDPVGATIEPLTFPALSVRSAVTGTSPIGVFTVTSH